MYERLVYKKFYVLYDNEVGIPEDHDLPRVNP